MFKKISQMFGFRRTNFRKNGGKKVWRKSSTGLSNRVLQLKIPSAQSQRPILSMIKFEFLPRLPVESLFMFFPIIVILAWGVFAFYSNIFFLRKLVFLTLSSVSVFDISSSCNECLQFSNVFQLLLMQITDIISVKSVS